MCGTSKDNSTQFKTDKGGKDKIILVLVGIHIDSNKFIILLIFSHDTRKGIFEKFHAWCIKARRICVGQEDETLLFFHAIFQHFHSSKNQCLKFC